ncbi:MAG: CoA transferase, partial [Gemmatimonadetes bacterium]|nr:CoA transferase [Gemmatimonadota bacterium]
MKVTPLSGIRVIELAHIMAGPVCGLMLGDMGADVVKVERLPDGDGSRAFLPPDVRGESAAFMMLNRGKRGLALDLRAEEGRSLVRRLVASADVIIENFRAGTMDRMGLGYEQLSALNPRLVYCQITGYGRTGPLSSQGGFDLIAQGYAGLMSVTGEGPGRAPVKVGMPVTDISAGTLAAFGVVSALFERERTGKGQRVDTSLFEAGISQTYWQSAIALASGVSPGPMGSAHPLAAPYQAFPTADGWVNVGASTEATWTRLTEALNAGELREDERFRS